MIAGIVSASAHSALLSNMPKKTESLQANYAYLKWMKCLISSLISFKTRTTSNSYMIQEEYLLDPLLWHTFLCYNLPSYTIFSVSSSPLTLSKNLIQLLLHIFTDIFMYKCIFLSVKLCLIAYFYRLSYTNHRK